jgi:hypothetical protein
MTASDRAYYFGTGASIDVEKYVSNDNVNWYDADSAPGLEVPAGSSVYFKFVVTNDGNVTLANITLSDSDFNVGAITKADPLAARTSFAGQIGPFTAITGQHTNTATATGDWGGQTRQDTDNANYFGTPAVLPSAGFAWAEEVMYFTVDFQGKITKEPISTTGRLLNSLEAPSPDGIHLFEMEKGTRTLDEKGKVVTLIVIRETEAPPLPDNTVVVGNAYNFEPSDITFDKPVRLTLGYDVNELPEDVASVVLAYYNSGTGWIELEAESGVVAEVGKLTAPIDHFTIFAVLAKVSPPAPPPPPTPAPPANFELSNLSIIPSLSKVWESLTFMVTSGEEVTITVDVTNQGGQEGSFNAVLRLNGVTQGTKDITLGPRQSQKIVFTITENEPGSYIVQIGDLSGEFITLLWFNWWLTGGFAAAFILLCWLAWYYGRKPRKTS